MRVVFVIENLTDLHVYLFHALAEKVDLAVLYERDDRWDQSVQIPSQCQSINAYMASVQSRRSESILASLAWDTQWDLIIAPWEKPWLSRIKPAIRVAKKTGVKLLLWGEGYDRGSAGVRGVLSDAGMYAFARRVSAVIVHTEIMQKRAIEVERMDADKVFQASFMMDQVDPVLVSDEQLEAFRSTYDLPETHVLLYECRKQNKEAWNFFSQLMQALRQSMPVFKLLLLHPESDAESIRNAIEEYKLSDCAIPVACGDDSQIQVLCHRASLFNLVPDGVEAEMMLCMRHGLPLLYPRHSRKHHSLVGLLKRGGEVFCYEDGAWSSAESVIRDYLTLSEPERAKVRKQTSKVIRNHQEVIFDVKKWDQLFTDDL